MKSQPARNNDYRSRDDYCRGKCPRFVAEATLYIHLSGKRGCESDLQLTFTPHIKECSLLKKDDKNTVCMLSCPIFEAYKSSHSY